jgi:hypothetical protein
VDEEYDYPTLRDTAYYSTRTVKFLDSDGETVLKEQKVRIGGNAYPPTIEPTTDENYVYAIDHWEGEYKNVQDNVTVKAVYKKKREVLVGKYELLMVYIKRFFPALCAKIARSIDAM